MKKEHLFILAAFVAGVILAPKVRALPAVGKLIPTAS